MKNTPVIASLLAFVATANFAGAESQIVERRSEAFANDPAFASEVSAERAHEQVAEVRKQIELQRSELTKAARVLADQHVLLAQAKGAQPLATPQPPEPPNPPNPAFKTRLQSVVRKGGQPRALVIPKDASDAKELAQIEEDLGVMSHILDKAGNDHTSSAMGISVFGTASIGGAQNLFIEGHGAIFFLNVNYPLVAPPAKDGDAEAKEKPLTEWEEARREMSNAGHPRSEDAFEAFEERYVTAWAVGGSALEYDADRVEELKKDLVVALKNAANIRKLKNDETVTVVVTGASPSGRTRTLRAAPTRGGGGGGGGSTGGSSEGKTVAKASSGERSANPAAKLVLRVRKSDAEAFQNGKLNADEFRKKVNVMTY